MIEHAPVSFGSKPTVTSDGDYRFFAGLRSDPFFFDLVGFLHGFAFTGDDFFKSLNVFGIVLEVTALSDPIRRSASGRTH